MARTRRPHARTAALAAVAVLLAGCGGDDDPTVEVSEDPTAPDEPTEAPEGDDPAAAPDPADDDGADAGAAGPTPDPALVEDPCAPHAGREGDAFIEVVAPVAEQQVGGDAVELIGCSNVFEANVQWTLLDGDGRELERGFTTAECGSGCVGAFATEVPLDAAAGEAAAELHVYAEDVSGAGGEEHLTAIPLVLG